MELNYSSVKALSSPTRLKILETLLEKPGTPTQISEEIDRSKSTVTDHLSKLVEAGLVEKDSKEGRRRVVYSPTTKAKVIANGSKRKVTFSIFSSALSTAVGVGIVVHQYITRTVARTQDDAVEMMEREMTDAVPEAEEAAIETGNPYLIALGIILFLLGTFGIIYFGYFKRKIIKAMKK